MGDFVKAVINKQKLQFVKTITQANIMRINSIFALYGTLIITNVIKYTPSNISDAIIQMQFNTNHIFFRGNPDETQVSITFFLNKFPEKQEHINRIHGKNPKI
jgi:hypothetical protein